MSRFIVALLIVVSGPLGYAQSTTISKADAESLVRLTLRHEHINLASKYCDLDDLDKPGKPFFEGSYSFGASCDFPNTGATTAFGIYVVGSRTAEVWEYNRCARFAFAELREKQLEIRKRVGTTEQEIRAYRNVMGCPRSR